MGMKLKQIEYHLKRAAIARADTDTNKRGNQWGDGETRAARHEDKAAELIAQGLAEYAGRSMTKGAKEQRLLRRRRGGIDTRRPGAGRGRGVHNRGKLFGMHLKNSKDLP
jgi:hypothetical protein